MVLNTKSYIRALLSKLMGIWNLFPLTSGTTWEPGFKKLKQSRKLLVGNKNAKERSGLPEAHAC
jgi:hypothetical protein